MKNRNRNRKKYGAGGAIAMQAGTSAAPMISDTITEVDSADGHMSVGGAAAAGALTGAALGTSVLPGWGTAIGGVIGGAAGGISQSIKNKKIAEAKAEREEQINQQKIQFQKMEDFTAKKKQYGIYNSDKQELYSKFGEIYSPSAQFAFGGQLTQFNNGLTHEEGGLPLGQNAEVEVGETKDNVQNYIFSDRLKVPGRKITFSDQSKRIEKKYSKRPDDKFSEASKRRELDALIMQQENLKNTKINKHMQAIDDLGGMPEQFGNGGRLKYQNGGVANTTVLPNNNTPAVNPQVQQAVQPQNNTQIVPEFNYSDFIGWYATQTPEVIDSMRLGNIIPQEGPNPTNAARRAVDYVDATTGNIASVNVAYDDNSVRPANTSLRIGPDPNMGEFVSKGLTSYQKPAVWDDSFTGQTLDSVLSTKTAEGQVKNKWKDEDIKYFLANKFMNNIRSGNQLNITPLEQAEMQRLGINMAQLRNYVNATRQPTAPQPPVQRAYGGRLKYDGNTQATGFLPDDFTNFVGNYNNQPFLQAHGNQYTGQPGMTSAGFDNFYNSLTAINQPGSGNPNARVAGNTANYVAGNPGPEGGGEVNWGDIAKFGAQNIGNLYNIYQGARPYDKVGFDPIEAQKVNLDRVNLEKMDLSTQRELIRRRAAGDKAALNQTLRARGQAGLPALISSNVAQSANMNQALASSAAQEANINTQIANQQAMTNAQIQGQEATTNAQLAQQAALANLQRQQYEEQMNAMGKGVKQQSTAAGLSGLGSAYGTYNRDRNADAMQNQIVGLLGTKDYTYRKDGNNWILEGANGRTIKMDSKGNIIG